MLSGMFVFRHGFEHGKVEMTLGSAREPDGAAGLAWAVSIESRGM